MKTIQQYLKEQARIDDEWWGKEISGTLDDCIDYLNRAKTMVPGDTECIVSLITKKNPTDANAEIK